MKLPCRIVGSIEIVGTYPKKKKTLNSVRVIIQHSAGIAMCFIKRFILPVPLQNA